MTPSEQQDSRKAFEAHDREVFKHADFFYTRDIDPEASYTIRAIQERWVTWTASRLSAFEDAAKIAEESQKGDGRAQARYVTARNIAAAIRRAGLEGAP